ncbi:HEAT repeat domain-containing protein [Pseudoalteromonas sp. ASV78]|uniref:HEAT repeat domain-containing protein n=1 Tax=Pseudoalteromonas sp. ASV78 TaxID=3397851 RepID=UPI0039FCC60F
MRELTMKTLLLTGAIVIIVVTVFMLLGLENKPKQHAVVGFSPTASCQFSEGQTTAFKIESSVTAQNHSDVFAGIMSWHVDKLSGDTAQIRASFSNVKLEQDMTLLEERAESPQGKIFFLEVNKNCKITSTAFTKSWEAKTRLLVAALLDNLTFALPKADTSQWQLSALDGLGDYTAHFSLINGSPLQIQRDKTDHLIRGAVDNFGLMLSLNKSTATATFNRANPLWWQSITGEEEISVKVQNEPEIVMLQKFSLHRDEGLFTTIEQVDWSMAEKLTPYDLPAQFSEVVVSYQSYEQAFSSFISAIKESSPRYYAAALEMAAWLKEHPEDVDLLVSQIYAELDDDARPTAFLALQLSGLRNATQALSEMVFDANLSQGDQSRAASALADIGVPTQEVADLLLSRATIKDIAGNSSLLGVGTMVDRSDDPVLREHIIDSLQQQFADTATISDRLTLIDSMGNTADPAFTDILSEQLTSQSDTTRRRAADALARLPSEQAQPVLLKALSSENNSSVSTALIKALKDSGAASSDVVDALAMRINSSDPQLRVASIDLLGAQQTETAKKLLVTQYKRETDVHVKKRIGRYLPAKDLR